MSLACVFRVAAGPRLGFGHLMRARALARALGVPAVVSIRGGSAAVRTARSLGCRVLKHQHEAFDRAEVMVVDDPSPAHRRSWLERAARKGLMSVAVVDGREKLPQATLIVNGSIAAPRGQATARVLAGSRFYVLDRRIGSLRRRRRAPHGPGGRVLVALGGGLHVVSAAARVVGAVRDRCPGASIDVASGFTSGPRRPLKGARWLVRQGLANALSSADVAVVAGGVTLYEACAIGVPVVGLAVVPAQRRSIQGFAASGAVLDAGGPGLGPTTLRRVAEGVHGVLANGPRRELVRRAQQLVDGRGADRVAAEIRRLVRTRKGGARG